MKRFIVITSVNPCTKGICQFAQKKGWMVVIVGDRKSVPIKEEDNLVFLSVSAQAKLGYRLLENCPYDHYGRKNIGYIYAIKQGADIIYETDDDNIPNRNWREPEFKATSILETDNIFFNIYSKFTDRQIWPRGLPLDEIQSSPSGTLRQADVKVAVWQGLADRDPDVDAIYRLLNSDDVFFWQQEPFALDKNVYSPFNSQNTFWARESFPLMYLPLTVSFRFTDILRGYVAQRILWQNDLYLGVLGATVDQERNWHNLMKDFHDEIVCYTRVKELVEILSRIDLRANVPESLINVYRMLRDLRFVKSEEIKLLEAWLEDVG